MYWVVASKKLESLPASIIQVLFDIYLFSPLPLYSIHVHSKYLYKKHCHYIAIIHQNNLVNLPLPPPSFPGYRAPLGFGRLRPTGGHVLAPAAAAGRVGLCGAQQRSVEPSVAWSYVKLVA